MGSRRTAAQRSVIHCGAIPTNMLSKNPPHRAIGWGAECLHLDGEDEVLLLTVFRLEGGTEHEQMLLSPLLLDRGSVNQCDTSEHPARSRLAWAVLLDHHWRRVWHKDKEKSRGAARSDSCAMILWLSGNQHVQERNLESLLSFAKRGGEE